MAFKSNKQRGFIESNEAKGTLGHGMGASPTMSPHVSMAPSVPKTPSSAMPGLPQVPHIAQVHPSDIGPAMAALHQMANGATGSKPPVPKQPVFQQETISNDDAKNSFKKIRAKINKDGI